MGEYAQKTETSIINARIYTHTKSTIVDTRIEFISTRYYAYVPYVQRYGGKKKSITQSCE